MIYKNKDILKNFMLMLNINIGRIYLGESKMKSNELNCKLYTDLSNI